MFKSTFLILALQITVIAAAEAKGRATEMFTNFMNKKEKIEASIEEKFRDLDIKPNPDLRDKILGQMETDEKNRLAFKEQVVVLSPPKWGFKIPKENYIKTGLTEIAKESYDLVNELKALEHSSETSEDERNEIKTIIEELTVINGNVRNRSYLVGTNMNFPEFSDYLIRCLTGPSVQVLQATGLAKEFRETYHSDEEYFKYRDEQLKTGTVSKVANGGLVTAISLVGLGVLPACLAFSKTLVQLENRRVKLPDGDTGMAQVINFNDIPYSLGGPTDRRGHGPIDGTAVAK